MSANQSRRRNDPGPSPAINARPKIDNTLPYQGRQLDNDSIRLVEIQPAAHETDPVACTISEVTFGSRPKFEALSYMWGPEGADDAITLNGILFGVRKNLLDALRFLRRQVASGKPRQPFWIDAICINQDDVEERNRQLRIMDQIYFRASTVVVWLGSRYTEFQREMEAELKVEGAEKEEEEAPSSRGGNSIQKRMVRYLRTEPYWDRLWIIQEIGRARKLRVCFGNESLSWDQFMQLITMHNSDGNTGPLRLDRLLRLERYGDSHTLKRLLEEHREAKCSEPRDKVYGLIGLAVDAAQFPMDYSKSLYDVWKDTMIFMNGRKLFKEESQILPIGALVKSALMANHSDPLSQISSKHEDQVDSTQLIEDPKSPLVFCLKAVPLGCIIHVGPSASDVVSSASKASEWRSATQWLFPANELGPATREHDSLLHKLLESDESEVEMKCFNRPSTVVWAERMGSSYPENALEYIKSVRRKSGTVAFRSPQAPEQVAGREASVQPRLYLAKRDIGPTPRRMGIASGLVEPGDLVCWVRSSRRALLVRVVGELGVYPNKARLRVFGTALATEDMHSSTPDYDCRWRLLEKNDLMPEIQVDAGTIFMLLE